MRKGFIIFWLVYFLCEQIKTSLLANNLDRLESRVELLEYELDGKGEGE